MIYDALIAPFIEFSFMRRALVGVIALSLGAGPVGAFLMLRRLSLTGDAMAHAILPGAALAYLAFGLSVIPMTVGGIAAGLIVAIASGLAARATAMSEDASLAAFYLLSLALGVTLVSIKGSNIDLLHVLFGSVLALDDTTLYLLGAIATLTLLTVALLWRPLVLESVDPLFLRSVSRSGAPTHFIFLALVVLNLVAGFHALGTLLAVGLMMLPVIAARFWTQSAGALTLLAIGIGIVSGYAGLVVSYAFAIPPGPAITLIAGLAYLISMLIGRRGSLLRSLWPGKHLKG